MKKAILVLALVSLLLVLFGTACGESTPTPEPRLIEKSEVIQAIFNLCDQAATDVFGTIPEGKVVDCFNRFVNDVSSNNSWPSPNYSEDDFAVSHAFLLADDIATIWLGNGATAHEYDYTRDALVFYMCEARRGLQANHVIPFPSRQDSDIVCIHP